MTYGSHKKLADSGLTWQKTLVEHQMEFPVPCIHTMVAVVDMKAEHSMALKISRFIKNSIVCGLP